MATTTPPACITLNAQSVCGIEYNGYPVLESAFATQSAFDTFITSNFYNTDAVVATFQSSFGCTGPKAKEQISNRRFHASYQCSIIVEDAISRGCTFDTTLFPAVGPVLCESSCNFAANTLKSIFDNTEACPANATITESRNNLVQKFTDYCTEATTKANGQNGLCVDGASLEKEQCGFVSTGAQASGCQGQSDTCCTKFVADNPNASSGDGNSTASASSESQPANATALIGGGVALAVLVLLALICLCMLKRKRDKANQTIPDYAKAATPFQNNNNNNNEYNPQPPSNNNNNMYEARNDPGNYQSLHNSPSPQQNQLPYNSPQQQNFSPSPALSQTQPILAMEANNGSSSPPSNGGGSAMATPVMSPASTNITDQKDTQMMVVIHPYYPTLADELRLEVGADLVLIRSFDDGWALGMNPISGQQGAFPVGCVSTPDQAPSSGNNKNSTNSDNINLLAPDEKPSFNKRISSQGYANDEQTRQLMQSLEQAPPVPAPTLPVAKNPTVSQFYGEYLDDGRQSGAPPVPPMPEYGGQQYNNFQ